MWNSYMWDMVFPRTFSCILVIVFVIVLLSFWNPQRFTHFGGLTDSNTCYNIFSRMIHMGAVDLSA